VQNYIIGRDVIMNLKNMTYNEKREAASRTDTPKNILQKLVRDTHWGVRCNVARNPNSSSKIIVMLYKYEKSLKSPNKDVIWDLYKNKNLPYIAKVILETLFGEML